ncbi:hypothetical protein NQ318_012585 [Aromia moschata]|uniref:RNase H type-1 domain-containing protein n=1 Tax=Aromia moschata TaxID=1265417 RepID=A0AAV8YKC1_9CUCU|nr:hypothetical protein NQ318_012585 [Aromia moschata]
MRSDIIGRDIVFYKPYWVIVPNEGEEDGQTTGAGATNREPGCEISLNLGNWATVFQAEITAISACAQEMTRRSYKNKRIQIISDSQAALKALGAVQVHSQVVKACMDSLTQLAEHNNITLKWMRGHQGHEGNERADFLAKRGAQVPLIGQEPTCGLAYRIARRVMKRKTYIALGESPRVETLADLVSWDKSKDFIKLGRNQLRWIVGLFTGHCPLKRHLTTIGVKNDLDCRRCGEEEETFLHILCECPALAAIRHSNFGAITIEPKEVTDAPLETVLKFLKETGLIE